LTLLTLIAVLGPCLGAHLRAHSTAEDSAGPDGFRIDEFGKVESLEDRNERKRKQQVVSQVPPNTVLQMRFKESRSAAPEIIEAGDAPEAAPSPAEAPLLKLIEQMHAAQKSEDEVWAKVSADCDSSISASNSTVDELIATMPDARKFATQKAHEFSGADALLTAARSALDEMHSSPLNQDEKELTAISFLSLNEQGHAEKKNETADETGAELIGSIEKSIKDNLGNLGYRPSPVASAALTGMGVSLSEAREGAAVANRWAEHEASVLGAEKQLADQVKGKCAEMKKRYQAQLKTRQDQLGSITNTLKTLRQSLPAGQSEVMAALQGDKDEDGTATEEARFSNLVSEGDTMSLARFADQRAGNGTDIREVQLVEEAEKAAQEMIRRSALQATAAAVRLEAQDVERKKALDLSEEKQANKAQAQVELKLAQESATEKVKEAKRDLNNAQDSLLELQKECRVSTTASEQASAIHEAAKAAREGSEQQLNALASAWRNLTAASLDSNAAKGAVAEAAARSAGAQDALKTAEAAATANRKAITSQTEVIASLKKAAAINASPEVQDSLEMAQESLKELQSALKLHLAGANAAQSNLEEKSKEERNSLQSEKALEDKATAMELGRRGDQEDLQKQLEKQRHDEREANTAAAESSMKARKSCAAQDKDETTVKLLEEKLVRAEARQLEREDEYNAVASGLDVASLPTPPELILHPCGLYDNCVECTSSPSCGWHTSESGGTCEVGTADGPILPAAEGLTLEWSYDSCPNAKCHTMTDCRQCLRSPDCGYCGGLLLCMQGDLEGPSVDAECPSTFLKTWLHQGRGEGSLSCAPRAVKMTDAAVAQDAARRRYVLLSADLHKKQEHLYDLLRGNSGKSDEALDDSGNSTSLGTKDEAAAARFVAMTGNETEKDETKTEKVRDADPDELKHLTAELAPLRRLWGQAKRDLTDASSGNVRTFYAGFQEGLKAGEREAAKKAGYLAGMREVLSLSQKMHHGQDSNGPTITVGKTQAAQLKVMQQRLAAAEAGAKDMGALSAAPGSVNEGAMSAAEKAKQVADQLAEIINKTNETATPAMRLMVTDAKASALDGLAYAASAETEATAESAQSEMERLVARVTQIKERLASGQSISEADAQVIGAGHDGADTLEVAPTDTLEVAPKAGAELDELHRVVSSQARLPSPGESPQQYEGTSVVGPSTIEGGTSTDEVSAATHRDLTPATLNAKTMPMRFESTGVSIIDAPPADRTRPASDMNTVAAAAQDAAEMEQVERDRLEERAKDAMDEALRAQSTMVAADEEEQEARMDLEKIHVAVQQARQVLARAQQDRQHAAQTVAMATSALAAKELEDAEVDVEKATMALRAVVSKAESKQKVATAVAATAAAAHNRLAHHEQASILAQAALTEASNALAALRSAVIGTSRAAAAQKTASRAAAQAIGRRRRLS